MSQDANHLPAIILVDDEPDILIILQRLLRGLTSGHDVIVANNGAAALEQLALRPARLVITDYNMPGMNGLQLTAAIKARTPETYVVMITAYTTSQLAQRARERGVDQYLPKPFEINMLERIIHDALA
jgi:two-component system response regulator (stage 0 sporulation protein F)